MGLTAPPSLLAQWQYQQHCGCTIWWQTLSVGPLGLLWGWAGP